MLSVPQLQTEYDELRDLIHRLRIQYGRETSVTEKFKLEKEIAEREAALREIEAQLTRAEQSPPPAERPAPLRIERIDLKLGPRMNLEEECQQFEQIVSGADTQTRLILVHGKSGMGKTHLLALYRRIVAAYEAYGRTYLDFELKEENIAAETCLERLVAHFDPACFQDYDAFASAPHRDMELAEWQRNLTRKFFLGLRTCAPAFPLVLFFDSYNADLKEPAFKSWLKESFLLHLTPAAPLIVVIAGQEAIAPLPKLQRYCQPVALQTLNLDHYRGFAAAHGVPLPDSVIEMMYRNWQGAPRLFAEVVRSLSPLTGGAR